MRSPKHLDLLLVQECIVPLEIQVLLPLIAQLTLSRAEEALDSLKVTLQLADLLRLLLKRGLLGLQG